MNVNKHHLKILNQVYSCRLSCGSTDLRRSIDGLAVLVKEAFHERKHPFFLLM